MDYSNEQLSCNHGNKGILRCALNFSIVWLLSAHNQMNHCEDVLIWNKAGIVDRIKTSERGVAARVINKRHPKSHQFTNSVCFALNTRTSPRRRLSKLHRRDLQIKITAYRTWHLKTNIRMTLIPDLDRAIVATAAYPTISELDYRHHIQRMPR